MRRYSRCSLGNGRAFWCVWERIFEGDPPIAYGYETTVDEAVARAREVAGEGCRSGPTCWAQRFHRMLVAERRRQRPAKARNTHKVEYVYNYYDWSDTTYPEQRPPEATPYRIFKKTRRRIYVEDRPGLIEGIEQGLYADHDLRTFVIDRQEFERDGHARSRSKGWWYGDFYATAEGAISSHISCRAVLPTHISEAMARLDLDESALDEGDFKRAFRKKALAVHPDHGGDERDFLQLQEDCVLIQRYFGFCA